MNTPANPAAPTLTEPLTDDMIQQGQQRPQR